VSSDRPIFVVGCPRSGTTLLSLMIHAHPRLAMPPETRFLVKTWRKRRQFGNLETEELRRALADMITSTGKISFREAGFDPDTMRPLIMSAPPTIGSAFGVVFREFARLHGKARWGDKRPAYYQEVDVLLRLFPDAQIVHVMRDGRACVASLKGMPWWKLDSVGSMAAWSFSEYCMRRNQRRLPADVFYALRYESLVADPEAELRKLCAFLDEEFDESMLDPQRVIGVVPERKVWHESLKAGINASAVESWRSGLEPWELGLMETVLRRKLRRNGYMISGEGIRPTLGMLRRWMRVTKATRADAEKRWKAEALEAATATYPVAAQLTSGQRQLASSAAEGAGNRAAGA
jgi:hypothetical protein